MVPLLFLGLALASQGTFRDSVVLTLSTDRSTYYVGEPVHLTVVALNEGDAAVRGFFLSRPYHDTTEIHYRHINRPFSRFRTSLNHSEEINVKRAPLRLEPGHEAKSEFVVSFDPTTHRFVLDEPGDYEFQVSYRAEPEDPSALLVSNVATVSVSAVPDKEQEAFQHYSRGGMGLLAQFDPLSSADIDSRVMRSAGEMIDKYPSSSYADAARRGLFRALRQKLARNQATNGERALYEKLREMRSPDQ
jgi:hypothetical protein